MFVFSAIVQYLGFIVGKSGLKVDYSKLEVMEIDTPEIEDTNERFPLTNRYLPPQYREIYDYSSVYEAPEVKEVRGIHARRRVSSGGQEAEEFNNVRSCTCSPRTRNKDDNRDRCIKQASWCAMAAGRWRQELHLWDFVVASAIKQSETTF